MSDASGQEPVTSAAVTSTEADSPAQHRRGVKLALIARILATAGALLFAVGAWMPWVVVTGYSYVGTGNQKQYYTLALGPSDVEVGIGSFGWSALTVVGLLLVPLLWWRWRSQPWVSSLVFGLYALWVSFLSTPLAALSVIHVGIFSTSAPSFATALLVPELRPAILNITHYGSRLPGDWIATVAIVLLPIGAALSLFSVYFGLRQEWRLRRAGVQTSSVTPATSRPRVALPGASALTIGLALWAVGTFVMPWASVNCNINPLIIGTCTGLPYHRVLQIGIADATNLIDPLVAHYAVGLLLGGGAAMVLAGLWLRARSVAFCGWATLWLVLAAAFAWLADYGVGVVVEKHDALGLPAGTWSGENAVLVTLLGFVLALGGLAYLWVDALRNRGARAVAS